MEVITEKDTEVVIDSVGEVSTNSALEVDVIDNTDLAVSVNRKEFNIVGDELYIPKRYEDAPQWLRDLISTVTEQSYAQKITELNNLSTSLQQLIVELEVAKNTYTQSIISSNDIDERINTAITTLNSSLSGSDATIVDLVSTKATPEEASAIALNTISSSINDGEIGALVGAVSNTLATETGALANSIDLVHAEMLGGFESTADVIQTTQAYVGIDEAGASTGTGLSAYLEDSLGNIGGADSQVANAVYINNGVPTSKFEYTSDLSKNGVHYKSGFGLKTLATGGDGSAANPYDSEFWINAAKFKFTNDNVTGQVAPFTIDATGVTPQITFNGKVSFSNVTGAPGGGSNLLYNSAPMIANETKGWSLGWYNTGIAPVLGAGWDPWRPSGGGSVYAVVPGAPTVGTVFDVAQTTKVPVIGGTWYEASAYTSSHRCTSYVTIAWYDSNNTYITEVGGSQTAIASSGALSNWGRSTLLAQAPANAARAHFYVRSIVSSNDPYCFIAFAYLGKAVPGQVVFSDWSEGTSAGISSSEVVSDINSGNTTTINGGRITTGSITANQVNLNNLFAQNITYTGVITGGNVAGGGIIKSYNGSMVINLVEGSIYIA